MPHVNKKFRSFKKFFTPISRSLENSDMNKKPLSFHSTLHFVQQQNHSKFFHVFHFLLQNSLQLNWLKKDFSNTNKH